SPCPRRPRTPRPRSRPPLASAGPAPASAPPAASACSCRTTSSLPFARVEGLLHQLEDPVLACRPVLVVVLLSVLAEHELERELSAGQLVKRVAQEPGVLRVLRKLPVEGRVGRKLDDERLAVELGRARVPEERRRRDRLRGDRGDDRPRPRLLQLLQLDRRRT